MNSEKIKAMKIKMENLSLIPQEQWTVLDQEFMKIATDPRMSKMFSNIQPYFEIFYKTTFKTYE